MALLMVALRVGDRALPLAWRAEEGAANIGFAGQRAVLEQILAWLPCGARVLLSADRFYPSAALHVFLSICAVFKLECLKRVHKLNHFAPRAKLYVEALQHVFGELRRLKAAA
nr:hypothetical protein [Thiocystis violacea]